MHSSVLQNKKYIKFAYENTVEVVAVSSLDKAIEKEDPKAATYKDKDEKGNEVEYLVSWPGLTVDDMKSLTRSKAPSYNDSKGIPHVAIVNPHTLEKFDGWNGGSAGKIMDAVEEAHKKLEKEYGKSLSRKTLERVRKDESKVREEIDSGDMRQAWLAYASFEKKIKNKGKAIDDLGAQVMKDLLAATDKKLDEIDALHARGETKDAEKELSKFLRYLQGTPLEEKANKLMEKLNPPEA